MKFIKQALQIEFEEFKKNARSIKAFQSFPRAKRYEVLGVDDDIMRFKRLDANRDLIWAFDLKDVYNAYCKLEDFNTSSFKKYVHKRHSPARGLLVKLNLLKSV